MNHPRVCVIGDSLFAHSVVQALSESGLVQVVAVAPSPEAAMPLIDGGCVCVDVIIVAGTIDEDVNPNFVSLLTLCPKLPIIRTTLDINLMQITTSKSVQASVPDLLEAITDLSK